MEFLIVNFKKLRIITNNSLYYLEPKIFSGRISDKITWYLPPCKKCNKLKDLKCLNSQGVPSSNHGLDISFNPQGGGFIISNRVSTPATGMMGDPLEPIIEEGEIVKNWGLEEVAPSTPQTMACEDIGLVPEINYILEQVMKNIDNSGRDLCGSLVSPQTLAVEEPLVASVKAPRAPLVEEDVLSQNSKSSSNHGMSKEEKEASCAQLAEDLIDICTEDSIKVGLTVEKEKLIKKLLILGGKGYTHKDMRNDLTRLENEDNLRGLEHSQEP